MALAVAGAAVAQDPNRSAATEATSSSAQQEELAGTSSAKGQAQIDGNILHAQVLLDRAGFSPGVIDGLEGLSFHEALRGFQTSRGLEVTGELDQPTRAALLQDQAPSTLSLRIADGDAVGPFIGRVPDEPADQAKMEHLGYRNLLEKIAEKFHTTPATIVALNDPKALLKAGTVLRL